VISTLVAMDLLISTLQDTGKDMPDKWDGLMYTTHRYHIMTWIHLGTHQNTEQYKCLNHMSVIYLSCLLLLNKYGSTVSKSERVRCNFYQAEQLMSLKQLACSWCCGRGKLVAFLIKCCMSLSQKSLSVIWYHS